MKIVQITQWQPTVYTGFQELQCYLIALCDDGSLWRTTDLRSGWTRMATPGQTPVELGQQR